MFGQREIIDDTLGQSLLLVFGDVRVLCRAVQVVRKLRRSSVSAIA